MIIGGNFFIMDFLFDQNEGIKKWEKEKSVDMFDRPRTIITVECF